MTGDEFGQALKQIKKLYKEKHNKTVTHLNFAEVLGITPTDVANWSTRKGTNQLKNKEVPVLIKKILSGKLSPFDPYPGKADNSRVRDLERIIQIQNDLIQSLKQQLDSDKKKK